MYRGAMRRSSPHHHAQSWHLWWGGVCAGKWCKRCAICSATRDHCRIHCVELHKSLEENIWIIEKKYGLSKKHRNHRKKHMSRRKKHMNRRKKHMDCPKKNMNRRKKHMDCRKKHMYCRIKHYIKFLSEASAECCIERRNTAAELHQAN